MEINVLIEEGIVVEAGADWLQRIMEKTLQAENVPSTVEISLVLTGQEQIQALNRDYRGKDQPTDVLSFALQENKEGEEMEAFIGPPDGLLHLGEIIISYPQAEIQAAERGHSVKKELAELIVHGILHILGYDHEKVDLEPTMTAREKAIMVLLEGDLL
jgi:probable rRNA maturation factor